MENSIFLFLGVITACLINSIILFQFMEDRYEKRYQNKSFYVILGVVTCVLLLFINLLEIPVLNMVSWIVIFSAISVCFYTENSGKIYQRVFEVTALLLLLSICETVGYAILDFILWSFELNHISEEMLWCLKITCSRLVIILFYYFVIARFWRTREQKKFTSAQFILYFLLIAFNTVNLSVIILIISKGMAVSFTERLLLLVNMLCIVFGDLFLIYFTKYTEENGNLRLRLNLLEQQSALQYEYYVNQQEKYKDSVKILHDVNKHLDMLREIYQSGDIMEAVKYADEIEHILKPLVLTEYTNHPILNILLNDKKSHATLHGIKFEIKVGVIDLSFMESSEITTIFGNLLDNALEACDKVSDRKKVIQIKLDTYNDIVGIQISNTSNPIKKWRDGRPCSVKGAQHGIGLLNVESVIKKYNGNMTLEEINGVFQCDIIMNA